MKNKINKSIKYLILSLAIMLTSNSYLAMSVFAASNPTPFPSQNQISTDSSELEKIQKIKDIVASKVAELNLVEKRGIIGTVKDVSDMQITIVDIKGKTRHIDVDELTNFSFSTKSSVGISDIGKGETYSFVGLYNKETERLLARDIDSVDSVPVYFEGAIFSVDSDNYQLTVVNEKGDKKIVDIQNSTKTTLATDNGDLEKSGFSKLSTNERVLAVGFWDKKDKNLLSTLRVIHFQDAPPSKEMQSFISAASASAKEK
jgi:hypothetical protein